MNKNSKNRICNVAIVGPYLAGKTTLLESLLAVTGAISRKGSIKEGNTIGDSTAEARLRQMSVEISTGTTIVEDVQFTFIDCPGSIEFSQDTYNALIGVDAAIIVCEPTIDRVLTLSPLFKFLDDWEIPHLGVNIAINTYSSLETCCSNCLMYRTISCFRSGLLSCSAS